MSTETDAPDVPKILARWDGPDVVTSPEHGTLTPGESVVEIGAHEAVQSDHWTPMEDVDLPDAEAEARAARVKELVDGNSRDSLDAIARDELGLDPAEFSNKTDLAEAIVTAQEG